jgi:hypothetical protein
MPQTRVVLYQDEDGSVSLLKWLDRLHDRARAKVLTRIERAEGPAARPAQGTALGNGAGASEAGGPTGQRFT